jgi:hypothetical protein
MNSNHAQELAAFPAVLRSLIDAELAAGNEIVEIASSFPAPPAGAYVKLRDKVSTRERTSGDGLDFYERNSSLYSGEFTDAKRFYFVIEPPDPPPSESDMNAIRAALAAKIKVQDERWNAIAQRTDVRTAGTKARRTNGKKAREKPAWERFRDSMKIDYEKWHDGIGYDVDIIRNATSEELLEIESLLVTRGISDWRDVEALAVVDSPRARMLLRQTLEQGNAELASAVLRYAPYLSSKTEQTEALVRSLETAQIFGGLAQTLMHVRTFHPPEIIDALLRGALNRPGDVAAHYAAMLMFIHGKAKSDFDWEQRPFFLRFNTPDRAGREKVFRELCEKIGVDAGRYL